MKTLILANLLNTENLTKEIASIKTLGAKLDNKIQLAACSAIQNHAEHYSTSLINMLIEAMPKGSRVNALRAFIEEYSGCSYDEETKLFVNDKSKTANIVGAMDSAWVEFKPEPAYHAMKLEVEIKKLIDKATKAMNDTNPEHQAQNEINLEQMIALGKVVGLELDIETDEKAVA